MDRALAPFLRIAFPPPGFFLTDVRFVVMLDGGVVYDGSFQSGMQVEGTVTVGRHRVTTAIELGIARRTRDYDIDVPAGRGITLELAYSRFWGNFSRKPKLVPW